MIKALKINPMVSAAAKMARVSRESHYNWLEKDKQYKKQVEEIQDEIIDIVESKLVGEAKKGNIKAIIFFLKHKGSSRGYSLPKGGEISINTTNNTINISGPIGELKKLQEESERKKNVTIPTQTSSG